MMMRRTGTCRRWVLVALTGLVSVAGAQPLEGLPQLRDSMSSLVEGGYCVAHELSVPLQGFHVSGSGFHVSGSVGGMMLGPIVYTGPAQSGLVAWLQPLSIGAVLAATGQPSSSLFLAQELDQNVVIVVADDFAHGQFLLPPAVFDLEDTVADHNELLTLVNDGALSHGALVMHHLNMLIEQFGEFDRVTDVVADDVTIWSQRSSSSNVVVAALDMSVQGLDDDPEKIDADEVLTSLGTTLSDRILQLSSDLNMPLDAVVVNMSWVFLPCSTVEAFADDIERFNSPGEYFDSLAIPAGVGIETVLQLMTQVQHPGLTAIFGEEPRREWPFEVAFVAASGNFSLEYQMLPAGWPQVVGAGVTPMNRSFPADYSNMADVTVAGEWVELLRPANNAGPLPALSYAGTSFASPFVSLFVAIDLAGEQRCSEGYPNVSELVDDSEIGEFLEPKNEPLIDVIDKCM